MDKKQIGHDFAIDMVLVALSRVMPDVQRRELEHFLKVVERTIGDWPNEAQEERDAAIKALSSLRKTMFMDVEAENPFLSKREE